jgi:hypothetical protein
MSDEEIIWEIDKWGDLLVEKIDETGSMKMRLGPVASALSALRELLVSAAQGTEARRAEATGSACDGPVAESDAPNENQSTSRLGERP